MAECMCCGEDMIEERGSFEICETCGWEDDPLQSADPYLTGGANFYCLKEYQTIWKIVESVVLKYKNNIDYFRLMK